jgi:hypothetical protein
MRQTGPKRAGMRGDSMAMLFEFHGPADQLEPVRRALSWVVDPLTGCTLLHSGALRRVRMEDGCLRVQLCLPDSPLRQLLVEDAQAELFDHLHGQWKVEISVVEPPPEPKAARAAVR